MKKQGLYLRSYATGNFGRHKNFHRGVFVETIDNQRLKPIRVLKSKENHKILQAFYSLIWDNSDFSHSETKEKLKEFYYKQFHKEQENFYTLSANYIRKGFLKIFKELEKDEKQSKTKNFQILKELLGE